MTEINSTENVNNILRTEDIELLRREDIEKGSNGKSSNGKSSNARENEKKQSEAFTSRSLI